MPSTVLEISDLNVFYGQGHILHDLSLQIGSEVSLPELSNVLGIDKKTVERYIELLEKSYVVFKLSPFSRNKRREISKTKKI